MAAVNSTLERTERGTIKRSKRIKPFEVVAHTPLDRSGSHIMFIGIAMEVVICLTYLPIPNMMCATETVDDC